MVMVIRFKSDGELYMLRPEHADVFIRMGVADMVKDDDSVNNQ